MKRFSAFAVLLTAFLLIFVVSTTMAQDTTSATPTSPDSLISTALSALVGFVVGAAATFASMSAVVKIALNDPVKMSLAESVGNSIPKDTGLSFADSLQTFAQFIVEATDRKPMLLKTEDERAHVLEPLKEAPSIGVPRTPKRED